MVDFKIIANGKDVTETIKKSFISLTLIDEVGTSADEVTIKVENGFKRPSYKDEIKIFINGSYYGIYIVQSTTKTDTTLTIKATATDFTNSLKRKHSRSFEQIKLRELIAKLASENDLSYKCDIDLVLQHLAQTNESDLHLLSRLAKQYNAQFNIKNNTVVFIKTKQENDSLPKFKIKKNESVNHSIKHNAKTIYKSVKVTWHDTKENKQKEIIYKNGEPQFVIQGSFKNEAEAYKIAKSRFEILSQGSVTGNITIEGKEIRAGGILLLNDFAEDSGEYSIKKVTHSITPNGYTTRIDFEK